MANEPEAAEEQAPTTPPSRRRGLRFRGHIVLDPDDPLPVAGEPAPPPAVPQSSQADDPDLTRSEPEPRT